MKSNPYHGFTMLKISATACRMAPFSSAIEYTWDGTASGATWDTSATHWATAPGAPWDATNGILNTAVFNTTSLSATVGTVDANAIRFDECHDEPLVQLWRCGGQCLHSRWIEHCRRQWQSNRSQIRNFSRALPRNSNLPTG